MKDSRSGEVPGWFTKETKKGQLCALLFAIKAENWLQFVAVFSVGRGPTENSGNDLGSESEDQWFLDLLGMWPDNLLNIF